MHAVWTTTKSGIHPTSLRSSVLIVLLVLLSYNNAAQTTRLGRRIDTAAVVAANREGGGGGVPSRNAATTVASMSNSNYSKANAKSVVVIGATGFVGSHLVRNLLHKGYHVEGTCRSLPSAHWLWDIAPNAKEHLHLHEFTLATDTTAEGTFVVRPWCCVYCCVRLCAYLCAIVCRMSREERYYKKNEEERERER